MALSPTQAVTEVTAREWTVRAVEDGWIVETAKGARVWPHGRAVESEYLVAIELAIAETAEREAKKAERDLAGQLRALEASQGIEAIEVEEPITNRTILAKRWRMIGETAIYETAQEALGAAAKKAKRNA